MKVRKNAASMSEKEVGAFLQAILRLKAKIASPASDMSVYDQFAALHGAVMSVQTPRSGDDGINFAHGNIGFLPWHRQYLNAFEAALQAEVPEVTIPYWDWSDELGAVERVFAPNFLGYLNWGNPRPLCDGVLQFDVPVDERPDWWPEDLAGFRVNALLEEGLGTALSRGSIERTWPPREPLLNALVEFGASQNSSDGPHPLWTFWVILEQGSAQIPQTHNAGHRFVGGHMGGAFSPNDPIFWLHHANVDRLWDAWQQRRIMIAVSSNHEDTWPDSSETSPFNGSPAPEGHKIGDAMWPWVGDETGYASLSVSADISNRLPQFSERVTVDEVLDLSALDVTYQ